MPQAPYQTPHFLHFISKSLESLFCLDYTNCMPSSRQNARPIHLNRQLWIVFSVTLTAVMGVSSITPAFPLIADQFGVAVSRTGLLITFFFLPGVVLTPIFGLLADKFGRIALLAPALVIFSLAGVACAFAPEFWILLGTRTIQGVGAASIGAINLAVIGDLFDGNSRTKAMGYNATVLGIGTAIYPAIGGGLAEIAWYAPFFMPVIGLPVAAVVWFNLDVPSPVRNGDSLQLRSLLSGLFGRAKMLGALLISFAIFVILFGPYLTYLPIVLDANLGFDSAEIGIALSGASLCGALTAGLVGKLSERFRLSWILIIGFGLYIVVLGAVPFVDSAWVLAIVLTGYGVSQGLNLPTSQSLVASLAPAEVRGTYMAINSTVYKWAQTVAPVASAFLHEHYGLSSVFWVASAFSATVFAGLVVSIYLPKFDRE